MSNPTAILVAVLTLAALWCIWRYFPVWRFNGEVIRLHQWPSWRLVYNQEKLRHGIDAAMRLHGLARLEALIALVPGSSGRVETWRLSSEIVATGLPEALPWADLMLDQWGQGDQVLKGVRLALKRKLATEDFRMKIFQRLVPWLTADESRCKALPETLLLLDPDWALRVLTQSDVLTPKSPIFKSVCEALRKHGHQFSADQYRDWMRYLEGFPDDYSKTQSYLEILKAAMIHDRADTEKRLWVMIRRKDGWCARQAAEFLLESHGQPLPRDKILTQVERDGPASLSDVHRTVWLVDMGYVYPVIECAGLADYFERDEADRWPEVIEALRLVGANHNADMLQAAAALFGPNGPSLNKTERHQQQISMGSQFPDLVEKLVENHPAGKEDVDLLILIYLLEKEALA